MATFTHLSSHARKRIAQRVMLDVEDVSDILDHGQYVDIGYIPGYNRRHLLFYSEPDQACFVAIRDQLTGTVVTVLPLGYHEKLAWKVSDKQCDKAQRLSKSHTLSEAQKPSDTPSRDKPETMIRVIPLNFLISGHYLDRAGRQKTTLLFKTPSVAYGHDIQELLKDEALPRRVHDCVSKLRIDAKDVYALSFRHGRKGCPVVITLR